jgi:hypothetical protein
MLFVTLCSDRAGTTHDRTVRRLKWTHPEGYKVIGEYWLQTPNPRVIIVSEAEDIEPILSATSDWDDLFDMTIVPAVTAEQGMHIAKKSMLVTASH